MELSELRTLMQLYLDDRGGTRFTTDELDLLLNRAQEELQKVIDDADEGYFSGIETYNVQACSTTYEFAFPSDMKKIVLGERIVSGADPVPVRWTSLQRRHQEGAGFDTYPGAASIPICCIHGDKFGVAGPSTSYIIRLWYTKKIPDLSGTSDVSEIPLEFHGLLALYAAKLGFGSEARELPRALQQEFGDQMTRLTLHIETRERQESRHVVVME
jgi:hypothetical protein